MAKVENTSTGARGLRNKAGELVMIEPGQTAEGDFDKSELDDFKAMLKGGEVEVQEGDPPVPETPPENELEGGAVRRASRVRDSE